MGHIIKFTPYPVIAGFMNGVAVLLLMGQVKFLLGLPEHFSWASWRDIPHLLQPWTILVAAISLAAISLGPRITRHVPSLLVGVAAGIASYYVIAAQVGLEALRPIIGDIPAAAPTVKALSPVMAEGFTDWVIARLIDIAPSIAVLAVIASIDSLMGAAALDSLTHRRHDSNRELIAQGLSNITSGIVGGLACSGAVARSAASYHSGARTRFAGIAHAMIVLITTLVAGPWVGTIPRVVLAAVLTVVAFGMMDAWSRDLVSRLKASGGYRREIAANLAIVIAVAAVTVMVNLIAAVAVGIAVAMALFVTQMSKSIVRRVYDGRARRSLKVRERHDAELLTERGNEVAVIELDGPLFFGTADALLTEAERSVDTARVVILDFRRVSEMDATGVRLLQVLARTLTTRGLQLLLAHVTPETDHGRFIAAIGGQHLFSSAMCSPDTDAALEWAEDKLVEWYAPGNHTERELSLAELCLADGFAPADVDIITGYVHRREFNAGDKLFTEGTPGDAMYLLARGTVTIRLARGDGGAIRLATLIPGVMFGEMALLESQPRSADAIATTDLVVHEMNKAGFARILTDHPALAARLMTNMARAIAARLRVTSDHLRAVS
ncbi:MAG: cyclic nucleotide-binding domain-containing protein [Rhodospirillaceae bacterium]|nr:cyclic nucleotide-binding domain-containing protein [Rhodospirillaceae bacterium]